MDAVSDSDDSEIISRLNRKKIRFIGKAAVSATQPNHIWATLPHFYFQEVGNERADRGVGRHDGTANTSGD